MNSEAGLGTLLRYDLQQRIDLPHIMFYEPHYRQGDDGAVLESAGQRVESKVRVARAVRSQYSNVYVNGFHFLNLSWFVCSK